MGIQKYINMRTGSADKASMSSSQGFAPSGVNEYIRRIAAAELDRKDRSKSRRSEPVTSKYGKVISALHKYGVYTYLGNVKREMPAAEICGKLKILRASYAASELTSHEYITYKLLLARLSKRAGVVGRGKKKGEKIYVSWGDIRELNKITKETKC